MIKTTFYTLLALIAISNFGCKGQTIYEIKGAVNIASNTAFVDATIGNDATAIVGFAARPFSTIDAALDATAALSYRIIQIGLGSFTRITASKIKSNTWLKGSGKPITDEVMSSTSPTAYTVTTPTQLTGGTVIKGGFNILGIEYLTITDLGIDQGSAYIAGGGTAADCIAISPAAGNSNTYPYNSLRGIRIENVATLQNTPTQTFHGCVIQTAYEPVVKNLSCYLGFAGFVSKNVGGQYSGIYAHGCGTFGIVLKSDTYASEHSTVLNGFEISGGGGLTLQDNNSGLYNAVISNGIIRNCTFGVQQIGTFLDGISISNVQVNTTTSAGKGFYFSDIRNSTISNCTVNGATGIGFDVTGKLTSLNNCSAINGSSTGFNLTGVSTQLPLIARGNTAVNNIANGFVVNGSFVYGANNYGGQITGAFTAISETVASVGSTTSAITFSTVLNLQQSPTGTWIPAVNGSAAFNLAKGLSSLKLPAGVNGRIYCDINGSTATHQALLLFSASNTNSGWAAATQSAGLYVDAGGGMFKAENGALGSLLGTAPNGLASIVINGTQAKLQTSTDGGATWTDKYTFTTFTRGAGVDLYIICDVIDDGTGALKNPMGVNIQ